MAEITLKKWNPNPALKDCKFISFKYLKDTKEHKKGEVLNYKYRVRFEKSCLETTKEFVKEAGTEFAEILFLDKNKKELILDFNEIYEYVYSEKDKKKTTKKPKEERKKLEGYVIIVDPEVKFKQHEVKIMKDNKLVVLRKFKEEFWATERGINSFLKFVEPYKNYTQEDIEHLIRELDLKWRESKLGKKEEQQEKVKDIPEDVLKLLKNKNIFSLYNTQFKKRIVREIKPRKIVFVFTLGKLLETADPTSFNLCMNDDSGKGKDYVVENVLLMWEEGEDKDYIKTEKITPEVLDSLSKKIDWNYKIFYNADIRQNVLDAPTFKVFSSGAKKFYTHKDGESVLTEINGKPVMIITTARGVGSEEITRRYTNCELNSKIDQTKEIMKKIAKFKATGKKPEYNVKYKEALSYLKPIKVRIPFGEELIDFFPSNHVIMRTQWSRFLDMIGAVTVLHQYQRDIDKNGYYLANWEDYDIAVDLLQYLLSNSSQIPLYKTDKKIIAAMKELGGSRLRISAIETKVYHTYNTIQRRLMHLADFGLISIDETTEEEMWKDDGNNFKRTFKPTKVFSLNEFDVDELPKSEEILKKIYEEKIKEKELRKILLKPYDGLKVTKMGISLWSNCSICSNFTNFSGLEKIKENKKNGEKERKNNKNENTTITKNTKTTTNTTNTIKQTKEPKDITKDLTEFCENNYKKLDIDKLTTSFMQQFKVDISKIDEIKSEIIKIVEKLEINQ